MNIIPRLFARQYRFHGNILKGMAQAGMVVAIFGMAACSDESDRRSDRQESTPAVTGTAPTAPVAPVSNTNPVSRALDELRQEAEMNRLRANMPGRAPETNRADVAVQPLISTTGNPDAVITLDTSQTGVPNYATTSAQTAVEASVDANPAMVSRTTVPSSLATPRIATVDFHEFSLLREPGGNDTETMVLQFRDHQIPIQTASLAEVHSNPVLRNFPQQGCDTMKVDLYTGGANCCSGYYLLSSCNNQGYAAYIEPYPGSISDTPATVNGAMRGYMASDASFLYYEPAGQTTNDPHVPGSNPIPPAAAFSRV